MSAERSTCRLRPHASQSTGCIASSTALPWTSQNLESLVPSVMTIDAPSIGTSTGICPGGLRRINRPSKYAVVHSSLTVGDTAPTPVTGWPGHIRLVWPVNKDIIGYCPAISQARRIIWAGGCNHFCTFNCDHLIECGYVRSLSRTIDNKQQDNYALWPIFQLWSF